MHPSPEPKPFPKLGDPEESQTARLHKRRVPYRHPIRLYLWTIVALATVAGVGVAIVIPIRLKNTAAWEEEQFALGRMGLSGKEVVTKPMVATWLCLSPEHAQRVVEIRLPNEWSMAVVDGPDDASRGVATLYGDGVVRIGHSVDVDPMSLEEIQEARRKFPYLDRIQAGSRTLYAKTLRK